jgi:hypothetical protein
MIQCIPVWESFKYREVFKILERDLDGSIVRTQRTGKFVHVGTGYGQSYLGDYILASVTTPRDGTIDLDVVKFADLKS